MDQSTLAPRTPEQLELYSSAMSLSDMEIFIFPDLMYALVLANIMSPEIWKWREEEWFRNIEKKSFSYKINRIKQYVMDHYVFNLDLETWGLTTKEKELKRFESFIDPAALAQSNALFGYGGDKYYYDVDIRRHFGLDKYTQEVIPYWKTETVEAMTAFRHKEGYTTGAGECVSLSALYVAALFIVGRIPLTDIFMIATPLHSQNFIAEKDGFITNNRRIVTKKMWYNGTELSAKARRSIENERITIVSHLSGVMHTFYSTASIDPERFTFFQKRFRAFLETETSFEYFVNFLYSRECYWNCFQYRHIHNGRECYISLNCIFNTQRSSKNRFDNESRQALIDEIDCSCFALAPMEGRMIINELEEFLSRHTGEPLDSFSDEFLDILRLRGTCREKTQNILEELKAFVKIEPRLPEAEKKTFVSYPLLQLSPEQSREEITDYLHRQAAEGHPVAVLSLYAWRDMENTDWEPFVKAAVERNPVAIKETEALNMDEIFSRISGFENKSIYEGARLAQPDEVWNFQRGDGLEKAFLLWNILRNRCRTTGAELLVDKEVILRVCQQDVPETKEFRFSSEKGLKKNLPLM
ncbi:MAG: hypothetical protein K2L50_05765 [Bacteroidales bacterium]|nr:hypothetical protein [Bacteroidales bacterium]